MSTTSAPFGLRPAYSPSGCVRPGPLASIVSAYNVDIFQGSPVDVVAAGNIEASAPNDRIMGAFQGVEYDDAEGVHRVRNRWLANTVATNIRAYYTTDQSLVYEIQANATLTIAAIGQQYDWTALAGNATTGLSSVALNVASAAANAGLRVIGLNPGSDNDWGDAFPIVLVQVSEHQLTADVASV